jgi:hypothetical protein
MWQQRDRARLLRWLIQGIYKLWIASLTLGMSQRPLSKARDFLQEISLDNKWHSVISLFSFVFLKEIQENNQLSPLFSKTVALTPYFAKTWRRDSLQVFESISRGGIGGGVIDQ